ncbi:polynucleotide 5'-hydroxyl-kinase [Acrasis kona]|uniref:Polynucleotide 5'-hydroxyl-kinase n=1 Tax=Acrasis kona TaxID=1008807 RepID=A0AAW2Z4A8_9EUKA
MSQVTCRKILIDGKNMSNNQRRLASSTHKLSVFALFKKRKTTATAVVQVEESDNKVSSIVEDMIITEDSKETTEDVPQMLDNAPIQSRKVIIKRKYLPRSLRTDD